MAVEPARCAVVEDTPSGVTAAASAGMRVLGYAADSDASALRRAGAEVFMAMEKLPEVLGLGWAATATGCSWCRDMALIDAMRDAIGANAAQDILARAGLTGRNRS
jgi:hypothetical protein